MAEKKSTISLRTMGRDAYRTFIVLTFLIGAIIIFSFVNPNFLTATNIYSILLTAVPMSLLAIGECCCFMAGYFDMSVGMIGGLGGILAARAMGATGSTLLALLVAVVVGLCCGLIAGFLVSVLGMNAFITTFALQSAYRGVLYLLTDGFSIPMFGAEYASYTKWGQMKVLSGIQFPIIVMIIIYILMALFLRYRRFGRSIYLVGSNAKCAHISGISVRRIQVGIFLISGAFAAIAGVLNSMRLGQANPFMGETLTMEAIASVVLSGTAAGVGSLPLVFCGVMTIYVVKNGLIMAGLPDFYQYIAIGLILYLALILQADRRSTR